jgi:DNA-binding NtrC family response regulator
MRRILLVDDEANVLSALQRALRQFMSEHEVEIRVCQDPEQALLRCAEENFDVVMSDYRMPGLTGGDFLQIVKTLQPEAVRLVLSASNDIGEVMDAINRAEVYRYLAKPWEIRELEKIFAQAFAHHDEVQAARCRRRSANCAVWRRRNLASRKYVAIVMVRFTWNSQRAR